MFDLEGRMVVESHPVFKWLANKGIDIWTVKDSLQKPKKIRDSPFHNMFHLSAQLKASLNLSSITWVYLYW
jgi:hypothetical protein